jgi:hypothetical protein
MNCIEFSKKPTYSEKSALLKFGVFQHNRPTAEVTGQQRKLPDWALQVIEAKESHPERGGFDSWNRVVPLNFSDTTSD